MNSSPGWWKVGTQRERWGVDWYLNLVFPALVMSREKIQRPHKDLGSFIKDLKCVLKRVTVELKWGDRWGTRNRSEFSGIGVCSLLWGFCDVGWYQVPDGNTFIGLMWYMVEMKPSFPLWISSARIYLTISVLRVGGIVSGRWTDYSCLI